MRPQYGTGNPPKKRPFEERSQSGPQGTDIQAILGKIKSLKNLSDLSVEEIAKDNGIADSLAKDRNFRNNLKTTQLRKFFDTVINNQERLKTNGWKSIESDFFMMRANLAYAKGRKLIPDEFFQLVSLCIERIAPAGAAENQIIDNYDRFVELLQALVAYTKYYGEPRGA